MTGQGHAAMVNRHAERHRAALAAVRAHAAQLVREHEAAAAAAAPTAGGQAVDKTADAGTMAPGQG